RRVGLAGEDARYIRGGEDLRAAASHECDEDGDDRDCARTPHPVVPSPLRRSGKPNVHVVSCTRSMIRQPAGVRTHWSRYSPPTNSTAPSRVTSGLKNSAREVARSPAGSPALLTIMCWLRAHGDTPFSIHAATACKGPGPAAA